MAKNLVIVESPAKAGTIEKYLGSDYQVKASMGHIRDLPASKLGVDVDNEFAPHYIIPIKARKTLKALKEALKGKEKVLLATDLDREGEAIAWHISQALELDKNDIKVERITFDEITKDALLKAVANPTKLNEELVNAQQARRILDRLVGYTLSPLLWKKLYKGLSAGRVQSVALRLIVDRERERQKFQPVEYWSLKASLEDQTKTANLLAQLVKYEDQKIEQLTLKTGEEVDKIVKNLEKQSYIITEIAKKSIRRKPSAPYTTSTLQQDGVNKLNMSSKRVMSLAQKLYEGGHITYMRTDSVSIAQSAQEAMREHISKVYGPQFLPDKPNTYKNKSKNAQEAHEAIRPTNPNIASNEVSGDEAVQKVYDLIRRRALASQMKEAELEQTALTITAGPGQFRANGQRIIFPGFLEVYGIENKEETLLPKLKEGEVLNLLELKPEQHFTEPPPRFSEATLIKSLEEEGIGRPSTYAPTIDTLIQRRYVTLDQRRFSPEEPGFLVTDLLVAHFPEIVDVKFTASIEEKLDGIAEGEAQYEQVLKEFWTPFKTLVDKNMEGIEKINTNEETDIKCPTCEAPMVIKMGRFGKFLACSRFPDCKTAQPLKAPDPTGLICPHCGKDMVEKRAKRGIFFGCSGYPDCKVALWKKDQLPNKIADLEKEGLELPFKEKSLKAFEVIPPEQVPDATPA